MVDSVLKGYQMIQMLISYLPLTLRALVTLILGFLAVKALWEPISALLELNVGG